MKWWNFADATEVRKIVASKIEAQSGWHKPDSFDRKLVNLTYF